MQNEKLSKKEEIPKGYTRVTEVFKPYSKLDLVDPDILAYRSKIGDLTHHYVEMYSLNLLITSIPKIIKPYLISFKNWFDEYAEEVLMTEVRINSEKYLLTGKPDFIIKIKGDDFYSVLDVKTPANFQKTWRAQTAAYQILIEEELGIKIKRRISLRLDQEGGSPHFDEMIFHEYDKKIFLDMLSVHRFFNGL